MENLFDRATKSLALPKIMIFEMKYKYSMRCKYCLLICVFVERKSILYFTIPWIVYLERIVERTRAILNFNACAV